MEKGINSSFKIESVVWALLSLILTLAYAHFFSLWVAGYFLGILTTFSLTLLCWRAGRFGFVGVLLLAGLFCALGRSNSVIFLLKSLLPSLILGSGLKYRKRPDLVIFSAAIPQLAILGLWVVHYSEMAYFLGFQLQDMTAQIADQARGWGMDIGFLVEKAGPLSDLLSQLFFGFQFLSGLFEIFLVYLLIGLLAGKLGWNMVKLPPFYRWRSEQSLAWVFLLSSVLFLVGGEFFEIVSKNILLVLGFWYAVLGFSISEWFLRESKASGSRIGFYIFMVLTQILSFVLLLLVGFFDSWLDFRKLSQKAMA